MRYNFDSFENSCFSFNKNRSNFNIFRHSCLGRRLTWSLFWHGGSQHSKHWEMNMLNVQGPKGGYRF